jgi:N-acetylglucosaminyl-diphospho-decaprenol L-rhamnosyltransferase
MNLSIIIVNWNTRDLLAQCLASVYAHPPDGEFEIFVVDNASTDGSAQMVRKRFPQVQLIENSKNVGFAQANNQAIRESTGHYVLLLNPDTEVLSGALETLGRFIDVHPQAGAAGARLLNPDGTLQPSCHPAPTLSRELWRLFHLDALWPYACYPMAGWDLNTPREVDMVPGACLILSRDALDQVGLLDEDYFIYSEEVDLCYRLRQAGWRLYWLPQAVVIHYGGQSTRQMAAAMFLHLYQGKVLYFRKHHGQPAAQLYKLILLIAALARLLLSPLAWLVRPPQRHQHLALASHYRRLVRALPGM